MSDENLSSSQLFARWLSGYSATIQSPRGVLRIRRAEPRFQTRNYFDRFKIETATFDGTGQNPTDVECFVVEVSYTDQTASVASGTSCNSIKDL